MSPSLFLPLLRELAGAYQAFEIYSSAHIRTLDLTPPQFDIVATLGNTCGMSPKELGEKTLITKGTLTGVVDRLVDKGLVYRAPSASDGRCQVVCLTTLGEELYARIFPEHLTYLERAFVALPQVELVQLTAVLRSLRLVFVAAHNKEST